MKMIVAGVLLSCLGANASAQSVITFDVVFDTVYEASGSFSPNLIAVRPGPFNNNQPVPTPSLTGQVTLTTVPSATQLDAPPSVNTITLSGSFSTESGFSPSNGWSVHTFDNAVFDFYAPASYVATDFTSDPNDWPTIAGTARNGLISDQGPAAANPGGVCPFQFGCLSASQQVLFEVGTQVFNTGTLTPNFPEFADAGNHALTTAPASYSQTNPGSGLGFANGMDALVLDLVLDTANGSQPYADGVNGYPGKVRIVTFSNTGNTAYVVEGKVVQVAVPVPAAAWLFASALGLLGWLRSRVNSQRRHISAALVTAALSATLAGCFQGSPDTPATDPDNQTPVANAGPDQTVNNQTQVTLDGSGSSDADGDTLSYSWAFKSRPAGSLAALSSTSIAGPVFTPDVVGDYVLELSVDDDFANGVATDTVTITADDPGTNPPVANAGPDQNVAYVPPSVRVQLDGTGSSDPDMDMLTFSWVLVSFAPESGLPPAVPVTLFGADTATPFFDVDAVDQLGAYRLRLTVSDGVLTSTDEVVVTVAKSFPVASVLFGSALFGFAGVGYRRRRSQTMRDSRHV